MTLHGFISPFPTGTRTNSTPFTPSVRPDFGNSVTPRRKFSQGDWMAAPIGGLRRASSLVAAGGPSVRPIAATPTATYEAPQSRGPARSGPQGSVSGIAVLRRNLDREGVFPAKPSPAASASVRPVGPNRGKSCGLRDYFCRWRFAVRRQHVPPVT